MTQQYQVLNSVTCRPGSRGDASWQSQVISFHF